MASVFIVLKEFATIGAIISLIKFKIFTEIKMIEDVSFLHILYLSHILNKQVESVW